MSKSRATRHPIGRSIPYLSLSRPTKSVCSSPPASRPSSQEAIVHHSHAIVLWAALSSLAATTAFAQGGVTHTLRITLLLSDSDCELVDDMRVVMQDQENEITSAHRYDAHPCHWIWTTPKKFHSKLTHFSLRLFRRARTPCKLPTSWDADTKIAGSEFNPVGRVEQITFTPDPSSRSLVYAREVHAEGDHVEKCTETGILPAGLERSTLWNVRDVDLASENLRFRYFESSKDVCGLLVNAVPAIETARKKKKAVPIPLNRTTLVDALSLQRVGKDHCQVPNLSSSAIDISEKKLNEGGLKSLSVK